MPEKNHSSALWIISVVGLVFSTIVFIGRGIVRWRVLGPEDFVLVAAQVTTHSYTLGVVANFDGRSSPSDNTLHSSFLSTMDSAGHLNF